MSRPVTEQQRRISEINATTVATRNDARRALNIKLKKDELLRVEIELEQLAHVKLVAIQPLPRSDATAVEDPTVRRKRKLLDREKALKQDIAELERQDREDFQAWATSQDAREQADEEAALKAEFEREEAANKAARFAAFRQSRAARQQKA